MSLPAGRHGLPHLKERGLHVYGFKQFTFTVDVGFAEYGRGTECLSCHSRDVRIEGGLIGDRYHWTTRGHYYRCPLAAGFEILITCLRGLA